MPLVAPTQSAAATDASAAVKLPVPEQRVSDSVRGYQSSLVYSRHRRRPPARPLLPMHKRHTALRRVRRASSCAYTPPPAAASSRRPAPAAAAVTSMHRPPSPQTNSALCAAFFLPQRAQAAAVAGLVKSASTLPNGMVSAPALCGCCGWSSNGNSIVSPLNFQAFAPAQCFWTSASNSA